jgi:CAAX protease family protein
MTLIPWDLGLIVIVLAVVVPWRGATHVRTLMARPNLGSADRIAIYGSTIAFQWLIVGVTGWRCWADSWSLGSLGLGPANPRIAVLLGAAMGLALAVLQLASLRQLARVPAARRSYLHELTRKLMPHTFTEVLPFIALVCTVSLCEEFLYRGFIYSTFLRLAAGWAVVAVLGSAVLFGFAHLYQGRRGVVSTFVLGVAFATARLWTASLIPGIIAHFTVDLVGGLGASREFLRHDGSEEGARGPTEAKREEDEIF